MPFRRKLSSASRLRLDRDLYEVARRALGPDSAAEARSHPDAIRLVGHRFAEWEQVRARAGLRDHYPDYHELRAGYPAVIEAEIRNTDAAARLVMFGAVSEDPAAGPSDALLRLGIEALGPRKSLGDLNPETHRGILGLESAVLGHVFFRLDQLVDAKAVGQQAIQILLGLGTSDGRERAALVLALDVMAFTYAVTGETRHALGWVEQAMEHLSILVDQGHDLRSAVTSHTELRTALA